MPDEIHSYAERRRQIDVDLRAQPLEWVELTSGCSACDSHESRVADLLVLTHHSNAVRMQPTPSLGHADDC